MGDFFCVGWNSGTGENKLPQFSTVVDFKANSVPKLWYTVAQTRGISLDKVFNG